MNRIKIQIQIQMNCIFKKGQRAIAENSNPTRKFKFCDFKCDRHFDFYSNTVNKIAAGFVMFWPKFVLIHLTDFNKFSGIQF